MRAAYEAVAAHSVPMRARLHSNWNSLGSHVTWQQLLEFAGDSPEGWRHRKVYRWLGVNEEDAICLLDELLELKRQLEGASAESISADLPIAKEQVKNTPPKPGFFAWLFGNSKDLEYARTFMPAPPPHPSKVKHTDTVQYSMDMLEEIGVLGRGAFGTVCLVRCSITGQTLALKEISKGMLVALQLQSSLKLEKEAMQALNSPFIVKLAATFCRDQSVYLLLEAAMGGDLYTVYREHRLCGLESHARFYAGCVALAFEHIHSREVIFRDLKMENIVMDQRGYCKLCDFGTATFVKEGCLAYTMCGTPEYMSPEIIRGTGHYAATDWWTLGILIYEMIMSYTPFVAEEPMQIFEKLKKGIGHVAFPSAPWAEVVRALCAVKPQERLPVQSGGLANLQDVTWFREAGGKQWWDRLRARELAVPFQPILDGPEDLRNFNASDQDPPFRRTYRSSGSNWDAHFEDRIGPLCME